MENTGNLAARQKREIAREIIWILNNKSITG
jgi:hypothetical protein